MALHPLVIAVLVERGQCELVAMVPAQQHNLWPHSTSAAPCCLTMALSTSSLEARSITHLHLL